jgi:WD40 repeat protein
MVRYSGLAWLLLSGVTFAADPVASSRFDPDGSLLPVGALARLGSIRFRHGDCVSGLAFSPDGRFLASASWDRSVRLWDTTAGREAVLIERGHGGSVFCVAFSPDGSRLASGGEDGVVRFWDPASGKQLQQCVGHRGQIFGLAFSRDGKTLATAGHDMTVRLWNAADGRQLRKFEGHQGPVFAVAISPDGKTIVSGSGDNTIRLWETDTGKQRGELESHAGGIYAVSYSPDGKRIASGSYDATIKLWDAATNKELREMTGPEGGVWTLCWGSDGKTLFSGGRDGTLRLWATDTGREHRQFTGQNGELLTVAVSRDGKMLAAGGHDRKIHLWDTATGKELFKAARPGQPLVAAAFAPDGKSVVTGSGQGVLTLWDPSTGREVRQWAPALPAPAALQFAPDGRTLAVRKMDQTVLVLDAVFGKELAHHTNNAEINGVTWLADGRLVGLRDKDGRLEFWSIKDGQKQSRFLTSPVPLGCAALSPDGRTAAFGHRRDMTLHVFDIATGKERAQCGHRGGTELVIFAPDNRTIASVEGDRFIHLWDAESGRELRPIGAQRGPVRCMTFSPNGRLLVVGLNPHEAERAANAVMPPPGGLGAPVVEMPVLRAGSTRDSELVVQVWEIASRRERCVLRGHLGPISGVAFSGDGRRLLSVSEDATGLVWDMTGQTQNAAPPGDKRTPKDFAALWQELASDDPATAYQAMGKLLHVPGVAVPLLKEHLQPVSEAEVSRVARLIADLNHDRYSIREEAMAELTGLGDVIVPALLKTLGGKPSLEVKRRAMRILNDLRDGKATPRGEVLQQLRAVELLEYVGMPEARAVLQTLAAGAPAAALTEDARAALGRLGK